jgi:signal transduction histidine kinase
MDTYVFVTSPEGVELVNPALPSLEGRSIIDLKDLKGRSAIREEIDAAMKAGSAWLDMTWFKPGHNTPALKQTFVRKAQFGQEIYIVGSGIYTEA